MSTVADPEGRNDRHGPRAAGACARRWCPSGRLDYHTEGLLLLTDDGEFAQRIAHPRYGSTKTYEVKVKGTPSRGAARAAARRHRCSKASAPLPPGSPPADT